MPVTTQSITAERGSNKNPAEAWKVVPVMIQVYQSWDIHSVALIPFCHRLYIPASSEKEITALPPTPSQIGQCDCPLSHLAPKNPAIPAAISGRSGIKYAC